jgi:hypothetical protein
MEDLPRAAVRSLEDVFAADRAARERAEAWLRTARRGAAAGARQAVRS